MGFAFTATLAPSDDEDWYALHLAPRTVVTARVDTTAPVQLTVTDATGLVEARSWLLAGKREVSFSTGGTTFVRVSAATPAPSTTPTYSLELMPTATDDFADTPADAAPLSPPAALGGTFDFDDDRDVFELASHGRALEVTVTGPVGMGVISITGERRDSLMGLETLTIPAGARGFVELSGSAGAAWSLRLRDLGPDDHSDEALFATVMDGWIASGRFDRPTDVDVVRPQQEPGHFYLGRSDALCMFMGPTGPQACSTPWQSTSDIRLRLESRGVTQWTLTVEDLGIDDHGGLTAPTRLDLESSVAGVLQSPDDVDAFAFEIAAGHAFEVSVAAATGVVTTITDSLGTVRKGPVVYATRGDLFTLTVSGAPGPFVVQVHDLGPDDVPNFAGAAMLLTGHFSGWVFDGDLDVFVVQAPSPAFYRLRCSTQARVPCDLTLSDPTVPVEFDSIEFGGRADPLLVEIRSPEPQAYELDFETLGTDDFGDTSADATPMPDGGIDGRIDWRTDRDVFSTGVDAGDILWVRTSVQATITGPDGGAESNGVAQALDGTHFVTLSSPWPGAYHLEVLNLGPDDFPNSGQSGWQLHRPSMVSGRFQGASDTEVVAFEVVPTHRYEVLTTSCWVATANGQQIIGPVFRPGFSPLLINIFQCSSAETLAPWSLTLNDLGP